MERSQVKVIVSFSLAVRSWRGLVKVAGASKIVAKNVLVVKVTENLKTIMINFIIIRLAVSRVSS